MWDDLVRYLGNAGNRAEVAGHLLDHLYLSLLPLLFSVLIAVPLGWTAHRYRLLRGALFGASNVIYTIPSLAMFVVIPAVFGTQIVSPINVIAALTIYNAALLVRPVADALNAVPGHVVAAATAMGHRPLHRFLTVELPLAVPVLAAGTRVASVSNISLVSVGSLIGTGGLGVLFTRGFQVQDLAPITVGIVLTLLLALVVDLLLVAASRALAPWNRMRAAS